MTINAEITEALLQRSRNVNKKTPWAHVAHDENKFVGVVLHDPGYPKPTPEKTRKWQRNVARLCGGWIVNGRTVTTVFSREEYHALLDRLLTGDAIL